jgi:hypothetical protein
MSICVLHPALFPIHSIDSIGHCEKMLAIFPSPAGMSLTKLSQAGYTLIIPGQGKFGK